jgi:hypothetical protein
LSGGRALHAVINFGLMRLSVGVLTVINFGLIRSSVGVLTVTKGSD